MLNGDLLRDKDRHPPSAPLPSSEPMVRLRFMMAALGIVLWALVIALRLVQLQILEHREFAVRAQRQSERTVSLDPRRGPILDRHGRPLAVSVEVESIYADPQSIADADAAAAALARALRLHAKERRSLGAQLQRDRAFVWVKRKVDPTMARAVKALKIHGVGFLTETRRYYPKRELAAQLIGYAGIDNTGMWGVEYAFDDALRGHEATVVVRTDAHRRPVGYTERPSTEGLTVVLTIDEAIQHVVERELDRAVNETASLAGVAVVLDPTSGEILALANRPTFNPNRFSAYDSSHWRNRAVVDAFEPGSIFKIITAAAALDERVVDPDEVIDCGHGMIEVGGQVINDHAVFDALRFREVIARSSDVGAARVAQRLGRRSFARYIADFGFGAPTGVALPGESRGIVRPPERWSVRSLPTISFGQEIGVTALQMASAASAIANGGYLMQPLVVRRIENRDGKAVKTFQPVVVRRVIQPATADTMTEILKGVVRHGTGKAAALAGYQVAGKTGTGQKPVASGGYSAMDHFASFVGYVPSHNPAMVILVSLDTPRGLRNQGGDVAAPLFARIADQALRRLAVPPEDPRRVMRVTLNDSPAGTASSLKVDVFTRQMPAVVTEGVMPDLHGRSARDAAVTAAKHGLVVRLRGFGRVSQQDPQPGSVVSAGDTCVLTLDNDPTPSDFTERRGA
ncbi:MAG: PASTA domain-containing protein [Vicinamibacteria bacterium]|nr:PASTA domain-containing protein [Vicinamibacteria bacterium]